MKQENAPLVFIAYRRSDSFYQTTTIANHLKRYLPGMDLFVDYRNIALGHKYVEEIDKAIESADAFIVVIGRNWLSEFNERTELEDVHRGEVEKALRTGKPVIPILLDGAKQFRIEHLPEGLLGLEGRQSFFLNAGEEFEAQLFRLTGFLANMFEAKISDVSRLSDSVEILDNSVEALDQSVNAIRYEGLWLNFSGIGVVSLVASSVANVSPWVIAPLFIILAHLNLNLIIKCIEGLSDEDEKSSFKTRLLHRTLTVAIVLILFWEKLGPWFQTLLEASI